MSTTENPAVTHLSTDEIDAHLAAAGPSPRDVGTVALIVARPDTNERRVLDRGDLGVGIGLVGDNYVERGNDKTPDGAAHPEAQLNLMNSRCVDAVSGGDMAKWALAGDQFFVDLDLSVENLPAGTRLQIGTAVIEVSQKPHTGCSKFSQRFGIDAARWVNAEKEHRRRGLNAMVVKAGTVSTDDEIRVLR